jgi:hypothetical protein
MQGETTGLGIGVADLADGSWKWSLERNIAPSGYSLPAPPAAR